MAFVENELVKQAVTDKGEAALPMLMINGQVLPLGAIQSGKNSPLDRTEPGALNRLFTRSQ